MNIRYARRRKNKCVFWSRVIAVLVILFPLSIQHLDFRNTFTRGLSISAYKASPAYAAFEDAHEAYTSDLPTIPDQGRVLSSGHRSEDLEFYQEPKIRVIAMRGMTIHAPAQESQSKAFYVAGEAVRQNWRPSARTPTFDAPLPRIGSGVGAVAAELVQEELKSSPAHDRRLLISSTGTPIVIRRPSSNEGGNLGSAAAEVPATIDLAENPVSPTGGSLGAFGAMMRVPDPSPDNMRPLWLTGQIEMTGGLAFTGPDTQMTVSRIEGGRTLERGRIWITEGKFEIRVKNPTGFLVAELSTQDGRVLGRGEVSLLELGQLPVKSDKITDIRLALHPTMDGVAMRAISGYSHGSQAMAVAGARVEIQDYLNPQRVNDDGMVIDPTLSRDSSFVARAVAKKHWPSLVVGQAKEPQDIRLLTNSMVQALIDLNLNDGTDRQEAVHQAVIWGRVVRDGKGAQGVQVEMAGGYQPIYFNEMYMPDKNLSATGQNGLFAFIHVKPGVQAVRAHVGAQQYPAQIFPTEEQHVSYLEMNLKDKIVSEFKVFDGLDMAKPISARVKLVGSDQTVAVGNDGFIEYSTDANPFLVEADAGPDFELSRVTVTGTPQTIYVPLVKRDWLFEIAQQKGISISPDLGMIVGYMDDQDFEAELTGYAPGAPMQIVYFDAMGRALDSKTGVAGGGFVIYNAPPGLQTLYVHPSQSRETFSQVVVAEPDFVQVVTH